MTKAEQNEIIVSKINEQLKDTANVVERVDRAFEAWFQALITPPVPPQQVPATAGAEEPK